MAKKPSNKHNEKTDPKVIFNPIKHFARALSLVGKPFYVVLSNTILVVIYIFYFTEHLTKNFIKSTSIKKKKIPKRQTQKKEFKQKLKPKPLKLLNLNLVAIKLLKLKLALLELEIFSTFKKKVSKISRKFKTLEFKLRFRTILIAVIFLGLTGGFWFSILKDLPAPTELQKREPEVSTKIYDRNGKLLYKIYKDKNRTIVPLSQIPIHVRLATLAAEDAEFYSHPGFSLRGIFRALIQDAETGSLQGGSTITQQLVKNTLLSPEKTITRKLKEIVLSVEVEATYTKDQILEMYLNEVSYGGTAYGIEEASQSYFGKNVQDLTLGEAAFLAGLTKSPTLYSPFGQNPNLAFERQKEVLHLMVINKFITADQEKEAENEKLTFIPNRTEINAPHFVMFIRQLLVDKYGEDMVEKGGLEVTTSLDLDIENTSEEIVNSEVNKLKGLNVGNGAALVVNPQTGEILAFVGSKNYFDIKNDGNVNVLTSLRQPGSSIKVVNYAYALENANYTPASIINDSPITFVTPGSPPYSPVNYDGQFRGPISLRSALAQSRNIPAVKVLASYGVPKMIDEGKKLGITTWEDQSKYGLSLTLGGGAVKAIDLATVYATIADYGKKPTLMPILQVKDYKGRILEKNSPAQQEQVLDPRVAFSLIDILKDNDARAPEFGYNSYLVVKDHPEVAVKTGTSNDLRDNWTVGFNQNYLVLTWVGNNNNSPMSHIASGVTGASPIWNEIMTSLLSSQPSVDWKAPDGISKINICTLTGTLPCDACPTKQEWFLDEKKPVRACTSDQIQNIVNPTPLPIGNKILENGASTKYP